MTLDRDASWDAMRRMRSSPPPLVTKGARPETFASGLEQAERLWGASASVGPIASPILLFYGLTQAARAYCAASIHGDSWQGSQSHGLRFKLSTPPSGTAPSLEAVTVEPWGSGLVQQVAAALGSPVLERAATLSALIKSSPEGRTFLPDDLRDGLSPVRAAHSPVEHGSVASFVVGPVPHELPVRTPIPAGPTGNAYIDVQLPVDRAAAWLSSYPHFEALGEPVNVDHVYAVPDDEWGLQATVSWSGEGLPDWPNSYDWGRARLDVLIARDSQFAYGWSLPRVGGNARSQHSLIRWWVILYTLSMLARYQPSEWRALLDVDQSTAAVPLAGLLVDAAASVPEVLADAFRALI